METENPEEDFIATHGAMLQHLARATPELRAKLQEWGVDILPIDFYSTTPSLADIQSSYEYAVDSPPYLTSIFNRSIFRNTLQQLLPYSVDFSPILESDLENPLLFFWENSQFSYSDAMAYYCFLRLLRPANIVEIGGGFSTLIASDALQQNGAGQVYCIDPYPRPFLQELNINLNVSRVQEVSADYLNDILRDGDILFIDSTHTVKTGSDCLHIYLRLLPAIKHNIWVHVHDVFLPFGMPKDWLLSRQIFWTEQYLLLAFLTDNLRASVVYGSNFNKSYNPDLLESLMAGKYQAGGSSLWFKYKGQENDR